MLEIDNICPMYIPQSIYDEVAPIVKNYNLISDGKEAEAYFYRAIGDLKESVDSEDLLHIERVVRLYENEVAHWRA